MNRNGIFRRTKVSESTISVASMVSFISIAVIVAAALFIGGCGSVPQSEQITYTPDIARLVTHVSTTVDYRSDSIRIRFSEPMDSSGPADRSIDFSPKFRFDSSWEDPSTLAITPRRALDPGTIYRGTVDLSTIAQDESIEGPLEFDVRAAGIEILEQSIGLESVGDEFVVSGTISFSADVGAEIDGAISLRRGMRNFPIDTIEMSDSNTIRFRSAPIPRTDHQRTISVELDQRRLGLSRSFERAIVIPALDEFSVIEINPVPGGAGLRLELSDALDFSWLFAIFFLLFLEIFKIFLAFS